MFPFLLIHEVLYMLFQKTKDLMDALATAPILPGLESYRAKFCSTFGVPIQELLCLGVFGDATIKKKHKKQQTKKNLGDGVPHQKNKSVECLTWNVLSLGMQSTRYLFACIGKEITSEIN